MTRELSVELIGSRETMGVGKDGRRMTVFNPVMFRFLTIWIAREPTRFAKIFKSVASTGDQFVDVGLMPGIPEQGISR